MGQLRIVAGAYRNRRIVAPAGSRVRPTSDRVREALYDILGPTLEGASVLDAYAGSGALGLEALSRGAASATFVEYHPDAIRFLRRNIESLDAIARCHVIAARVERTAIELLPCAPFDLVLADPPYFGDVRDGLLAALVRAGALHADARIVIERDQHEDPIDDLASPLALHRTARYGRTCLDFYRGRALALTPRPGPV